jgi:hypothetical protein
VALQHISEAIAPFYHSNITWSVRKPLPGLPEVPTVGFGYPFAGSKLSLPRKPLSAPNALKLCPSELFSSRMIKGKFPSLFSALAFPRKTLTGLTPTLQRLDPTRKAVPLHRHPAFYAKSGTKVLSWDWPPLRRSLRRPSPRIVSLRGSPLSLFRIQRPCDLWNVEPQGFSAPGPVYPS